MQYKQILHSALDDMDSYRVILSGAKDLYAVFNQLGICIPAMASGLRAGRISFRSRYSVRRGSAPASRAYPQFRLPGNPIPSSQLVSSSRV